MPDAPRVTITTRQETQIVNSKPTIRPLARAGAGYAMAASAFTAAADVTLPRLFTDHMVLQRDAEIRVWGWAEPGEQVTVTLRGRTASAKAADDRTWSVTLPSMLAGGPYTLVVVGANTVEIDDVMVGEVWVCSGQSNMEWPVSQSSNPVDEMADADQPSIRLFHVPHRDLDAPASDIDAAWAVCTAESLPAFSAVAYSFGRAIERELDMTVGLIQSAWGGTRIEPWTPPAGFEAVDAMRDVPATDQQRGHQRPMRLYNGMIHALTPYSVRGAIWYQGESNLGDGALYTEKMKALIAGWRAAWSNEGMPFLFVQLAPFRYNAPANLLPEIWEAQASVLAVPHTGMTVTTDITDLADIHPRNKQEVGRRLALWALAHTYGRADLVYSGPFASSARREGSTVVVSFEHVGGGLASRDGGALTWFEIAGADGAFVAATAEIVGDTVVLRADSVAEPTAVRFGWSQLAEPNLMNREGLPASPFRLSVK
jgi:sialate O-acetylesterase